MKSNFFYSALAMSVLLSACGGDSDDSTGTSPTTLTISGTAAAGLPLVGTVAVKDATGRVKTVTIGANGAYTVDVSDMTGPFVFRASGTAGSATYTLHSGATSADANGTINITPLTDLVLSNVAGELASGYFERFQGSAANELSPAALNAEVAKLKEKLLPVLSAMGVDAATDLLRTPFTPLVSALDKALDAVRVEYDSVNNTATLRNVLTSETISDDLAVKAGAETNPPVMSNTTDLSTAADDITRVRAALQAFTGLFAGGLPDPGDIQAQLTDDFLMNDRDKLLFASELAGDGLMVNARFTDVEIQGFDYGDANTEYATVTMTVRAANGAVIDVVRDFKLARASDATTWKLHGNQEVIDVSAMALAVITQDNASVNGDCKRSGLEFYIEDYDTANSSGVSTVRVTGPGLPELGLVFQPGGAPGRYEIGGIGGSLYTLTEQDCGGSALMTDQEIAAIPDGSVYQIALEGGSGTVLHTYQRKLFKRPVTLAEMTAASSPFPDIVLPSSLDAFDLDTDFFNQTNVGAMRLNTGFLARVYAGRNAGGNYADASEDLLPNAQGRAETQINLGDPGQDGIGYKVLQVETFDSPTRSFMRRYEYSGNR
ncbi:hypothetical protein EYS42_14890 [Aquabacterium lacunae]|uniref:Carboxypeptidase regulatory-like domain-containing protein n=1 Tax=Aquabacterium lacunae TaxID=2528630 RepID=A0A4Q9GV60_9BURK|nr:hypothetical protein [Aquabacterium lacunae]TBO28290.1 hypothetical protein EYS42_14890 [Aquabacterium lacunae]